MAKADEKLASAATSTAAGFHGDAASRACYAAFHAATAALAVRGLSFSSHRETIGAFTREFIGSGLFDADATRRLRRLFQHRQTADYDWKSSIDQPTAAEDIADATAIVHACRAIIEAAHPADECDPR